MFCPNCGNQIKDTAKFCPKCGKPVRAEGQAQQTPSLTAPQQSMRPNPVPQQAQTQPPQMQPAPRQMTQPNQQQPDTAHVSSRQSSAQPTMQQAARQTAAAHTPQTQRPRPENAAPVRNRPVQEPEPPQKKSPVPLILGGVILLAAIGGAAFFIGSQKGSDKAATEENSSNEDIWDDWDEDDDSEEKDENSSRETTAAAEETVAATEALEETAAPTINLLSGSGSDLTGLTKLNILQSNTTQSSNAEMVDANHIYYAWSAFDGLPETSWQEGRSDDGIGESITAGFGASYPIKALTLRLGNHRSQDWYIKNNRPKKLRITMGGQVFEANFSDEMKEHVVVFSSPVWADSMNLMVEEVYSGTTYRDTAIAEVGVYAANE